MKTFGSTGISYSPDHFTDEFVKWLIEPPAQPPSPRELPVLEVAAGPVDLESAFKAAWQEMSQDPAFAQRANDQEYAKALEDFRRQQAAPLPAGLDGTVAQNLKNEYTVSREPNAFVHQLNGTPILRIPHTVEGAPLLSDRATVVIQGVVVVIDVLSVFAAAAGVYYVRAADTVRRMQTVLDRFLNLFTTTANAQELQRLTAAGDKVGVITKVLSLLRGCGNLKDVLGAFLSSQPWWQQALMVVQLLASVALLVASAGASLAAKIVQLTASIVVLMADAALFVAAVTT